MAEIWRINIHVGDKSICFSINMILGSWQKLSAPLIKHEPLPQLGLREERQWRILNPNGWRIYGRMKWFRRGTYPGRQIESDLTSSYPDIILLICFMNRE